MSTPHINLYSSKLSSLMDQVSALASMETRDETLIEETTCEIMDLFSAEEAQSLAKEFNQLYQQRFFRSF